MNTFHPAASLTPPSAPPGTRRSPDLFARLIATLFDRLGTAPATVVMPLARGSTHWLHRPLGREIHCEAGTLWLAHDGEPQDIVLESGQSHRCGCASPLSIHALANSRLRLQ